MKLTNPTDAEISAMFAAVVADWRAIIDWRNTQGLEVFGFQGIPPDSDSRSPIPPFVSSFDLVLPWLEKWRTITMDWDRVAETWGVGVGQYRDTPSYDKSLPRATVIALLRAHGVEVEFTP